MTWQPISPTDGKLAVTQGKQYVAAATISCLAAALVNEQKIHDYLVGNSGLPGAGGWSDVTVYRKGEAPPAGFPQIPTSSDYYLIGTRSGASSTVEVDHKETGFLGICELEVKVDALFESQGAPVPAPGPTPGPGPAPTPTPTHGPPPPAAQTDTTSALKQLGIGFGAMIALAVVARAMKE